VAGTTLVAHSAGPSSVETGVGALDRLIGIAARAGRFEIRLALEPAEPEVEVQAAGAELGRTLRSLLSAPAARGHGTGTMATDEALATVVLEASGRPLVVSNVDLASSHVGGLESDLAARFFDALAEEAGLTIHVRLVEGEQSEHVVDAIFKALGVALAEALTVVRD
jgi:imidazoleglycerol-phosphate dehydratase